MRMKEFTTASQGLRKVVGRQRGDTGVGQGLE